MSKKPHKIQLLERRRRRVRKSVTGTPDAPRLTVFRSLNHIYAQVIDDVNGRTLAAASSVALKIDGGNVEAAKKVGKALADNAKAKNIATVRFDRNGRLYHGRVKALADAARENGLQF
jgi:large subunit ribosomal protein L18